jgi:hypothetical protein
MYACIAAFRLAVIEEDFECLKDRGLTRVVLADEGSQIIDFDPSALVEPTEILQNYGCKFHEVPHIY